MELEHAVEKNNVTEILSQLTNEAINFSNICLIHIIDKLEEAYKNIHPDKNDLQERLLQRGAILSYETLKEAIHTQIKNTSNHPLNRKHLKRLYKGLSQLIDAWQNNKLANQIETLKLDDMAIKNKLIPQWKNSLVNPVFKNLIHNSVKELITQKLVKWCLNDLPEAQQSKFNKLAKAIIIEAWQDNLKDFAPLSEQLKQYHLNQMVLAYKENKISKAFNDDITHKLKTNLVLKIGNYKNSMNYILDETTKIIKANCKIPESMDSINKEVAESLLSKWRANTLPQNLLDELDSFIRAEFIDIKPEAEFSEQLKEQAIALLIEKFRLQTLALESQSYLHKLLEKEIAEQLIIEAYTNSEVCEYIIYPVAQIILTQWKQGDLTEEQALLITPSLIGEMELKLKNLQDTLYPPATTLVLQTRLTFVTKQVENLAEENKILRAEIEKLKHNQGEEITQLKEDFKKFKLDMERKLQDKIGSLYLDMHEKEFKADKEKKGHPPTLFRK